jgi:hypothetical protein
MQASRKSEFDEFKHKYSYFLMHKWEFLKQRKEKWHKEAVERNHKTKFAKRWLTNLILDQLVRQIKKIY